MAKILILDDSVTVCSLYETEFRAEGHEVFVSHDPVEARRIALQAEPDVVVAEVVSCQDYTPLIDLLRDRHGKKAMFLILNTGWGGDHTHDLAQWADMTVQKSSDLAPLTDAVRRLCARSWFTRGR